MLLIPNATKKMTERNQFQPHIQEISKIVYKKTPVRPMPYETLLHNYNTSMLIAGALPDKNSYNVNDFADFLDLIH